MKQETEETPKPSPNIRTTGSIGLYAVQCGDCFKWRLVPTLEEYEEIRSNFIEDPWFCNKRSGCTCDDPADIEYDATRTWVVDKPNLPKTPVGFKRVLSLRRDYSKCDAYYWLPTGKKVRGRSEIEQFLKANPKYENVDISNFSFTVPKVMEDTLPAEVEDKVSESSGTKINTSQTDDE